MQYNNPDGKWLEEIPYMIINLEHDRDIYLGKDTVVAYAREEEKHAITWKSTRSLNLQISEGSILQKVRAFSSLI